MNKIMKKSMLSISVALALGYVTTGTQAGTLSFDTGVVICLVVVQRYTTVLMERQMLLLVVSLVWCECFRESFWR